MANRSHVFISHHHADDAQVTRLTNMLARAGHEIRNSSIRAKPANQARLDRGLVSDHAIKRLLRMKMSWASTVVVLIGKNTHTRPWVDWEINTAKEKEPFKKYGDALVAWNSDKIIDAIQGTCDEEPFEKPDGGEREPMGSAPRSIC